jgi:hypothetical protein
MKTISMRRSIVAMTLSLAAVVACGGSDNTGPDGSGGTGIGGNNGSGNGACTITLSGAQTGSFDCSNVLAAWTSDDNITDFGFISSGSSANIVASIGFTGKPSKTTYKDTDTGAGAAVAVQIGSTGWTAGVAEASPKTGSYALTISSMSVLSSAADGEVYTVHGTLSATLDPDPSTGASGSVTLNATF